MTPYDRALSLKLDAIVYRLERGGCSPVLRWWLRWRRTRLERLIFGRGR